MDVRIDIFKKATKKKRGGSVQVGTNWKRIGGMCEALALGGSEHGDEALREDGGENLGV